MNPIYHKRRVTLNTKREIAVVQSDTKQCLLDAALRIFAKHGFHGASVRDICKCADVNVGSVNYHFRGKEELYRAVIECAIQRWNAKFCAGATRLTRRLPKRKPFDEIQPLFSCFMLDENLVWPAHLIFRELLERGPAFDEVIAALRICAARLETPLCKLLGARTERELVQLYALNLVCQNLISCALQSAFHQLCPKCGSQAKSQQLVTAVTRSVVVAIQHRKPRTI